MSKTDTKVTKKQLAAELFDRMLAKREDGEFDSNKAFRAACIQAFQDELDVSGSSACTMYNVNKKRVVDEDPTISLGRDPKKVAPVVAKAKKSTRTKKVTVKVTPPVVEAEDEELLDRKVVNDTSGVVDLDPLADLDRDYDDHNDIMDYMGSGDVGGGDYM